jgi:hypothetical protein
MIHEMGTPVVRVGRIAGSMQNPDLKILKWSMELKCSITEVIL